MTDTGGGAVCPGTRSWRRLRPWGRAFVGNSGGANKLHPKRLSLLDDLVEVLVEHPIILNGGDRLEAEPVQRRAELTRGHAVGARELNFAESEVAGELQTEADILGKDVSQTVWLEADRPAEAGAGAGAMGARSRAVVQPDIHSRSVP